jgi:hypothetical protein
METTTESGKGREDSGHCHEVTVTVNGSLRNIRPGNYTLADLKQLFQIDPCHDLDEVICGELRSLEDSGKTHIEGGELFVSHVRCGASS